ncbi:unknown [plant metagenome]|uniref:Suppressor of fused-like domain-containing protein n=1 Tax=plant metagenome TaxID=1297885 RepID=A0A484THA5_9ZZZZ
MQISDSEKAIARHLETVFGARPRVVVHRQAAEDPFYIGIAHAQDTPSPGLVTLSTIGVSNHPLYQDDGTEFPHTRVEFIASCEAGQESDLAEALFLAATFVGKSRGFACPGIFLHGLIGRFRPASPVPHALLTTPFAYEGLDAVKEFAGRRVSWLLVQAVSADEIDYAQAHSTSALEDVFEEAEIDWTSLDRACAMASR